MKIIGYYASWDKRMKLEDVKYEYLTHINYAFLIPREDGSVLDLERNEVNDLLCKAHEKNVKVFLSVGGWSYADTRLSNVFEKICNDSKKLDFFIRNVLTVVKDFHFDGIDMDWEYPTKKYIKQYESLILKLKEGLVLDQKELSIAIPPGINVDCSVAHIDAISGKILETVDWINLMVYDNPLEENHSSYEYAKISLDYWLSHRKYSKNKIVLGVPFYSRPSNLPFHEILAYDEKNYENDVYKNEHYNGRQTLIKKTELAHEKCSGIMIWALNYDATGKYSLLKEIYTSCK